MFPETTNLFLGLNKVEEMPDYVYCRKQFE